MSEFGSGLVTPLVRIAGHFHDQHAKRVIEALAWQEMEPFDREPLIKAVLDGEPSPWASIVALTAENDIGLVVHKAISSWCYAASDHLLELNQKKAPPKLKRFQEALEDMRLPTVAAIYTGSDWALINQFFRDAVLEIDRSLLKVDADWGEM